MSAPDSSPGRRVSKNTLLVLARHGLVSAIALGVTGFVARRLGPDGFGTLDYAFSFVGGFAMLATFGLRAVTVRAVAQQAEPTALGGMVGLRLALAMLVIAPLGAAAGALHPSHATPAVLAAILLAAVTLPFDAVADCIVDVFQGRERFDVEAIAGVLARLATATGAVVALWFGGGLLEVLGVYAAGSVVRALVPVVMARRERIDVRPRWSTPLARSHLAQALPFAGTAAASLLMWEVNPVLLGRLGGMGTVGIYAAATRLFTPLEVIPDAVASALTPTVARGWAAGDASIEPLLQRAMWFLVAVGVPIGIGGALVAEPLVALLFGPSYAQAVPATRVVLGAMPFEFVSIPAFYVLGAIHRQRTALAIAGVGALVNLSMAVALIPDHGAMACAWSAASAIVTCCVLAHVALARHYRVWRSVVSYGKLVLANAAMVLAVLAVLRWGVVVAVVVGAVSYGAAIAALAGEELAEFRAVIAGDGEHP
jgi:O-antigen/teichoic acid export membrane protein